MKNVFFKPWVGDNYLLKGLNGKKLLILGESHICGGCNECGDLNITDLDCREFTTNVVKGFLKYKSGDKEHSHWMNTYTKFGNVLYNKSLNYDETLALWNSVIFYNYVQYSTTEARKSPLKEEFTKSEAAFFEILKTYQPDLIIIWGNRLWDELPQNGEFGKEKILYNGINRGPFYYYLSGDKKIPGFMINHPSSSKFDYSWYESFKEVLEMI